MTVMWMDSNWFMKKVELSYSLKTKRIEISSEYRLADLPRVHAMNEDAERLE